MNGLASNAQAVAKFADSGSPALVSSFGRLFGLGQEEQAALVKGNIPRWAVFALGAVAGAALAVVVYQQAPSQFSKIAGGSRG